MAGYRLTDEQRDVLDSIILDAVKSGFRTPTEIEHDVATRLVMRREPWATALSRLHNFKHYVKSGLNRLKARELVAHERTGRDTLWLSPHQLAS
jgi:hypothetical protein